MVTHGILNLCLLLVLVSLCIKKSEKRKKKITFMTLAQERQKIMVIFFSGKLYFSNKRNNFIREENASFSEKKKCHLF